MSGTAPGPAPPRLYVYYRVPEARLADTAAAVHRMQARLLHALPGLTAELLRRPELREGDVTLMECYAGVAAEALTAALASHAASLPQPRHLEWFTPLG